MGVRYIGSKARIADSILEIAGPPSGQGRFVDAFCGTGAVAHAAADQGWPVVINDFMKSSVALATAGLISSQQASFGSIGGYHEAIKQLNRAPAREGFMFREYSPESAVATGTERRYFTRENARKIDGVRYAIEQWRDAGLLNTNEWTLLLGDLMVSANSVANISGTYGCFLSEWTESAKREMTMRPRQLRAVEVPFQAIVGDVFRLPTDRDDVVYFDPPYTKRQYASYYHLLETLVIGDEPVVEGVSGLRPWRDRSSDFCYKRKALAAILRLVEQTRSSRILLSYSNEGHVPQSDLVSGLRELGEVTLHPVDNIGRYRPNSTASAAGSQVHEYVIEILPKTLAPAVAEPLGA